MWFNNLPNLCLSPQFGMAHGCVEGGGYVCVLWHILTCLSYYRELHMKSKQLMEVRAACIVQQ